jgi:hypothetical protein
MIMRLDDPNLVQANMRQLNRFRFTYFVAAPDGGTHVVC